MRTEASGYQDGHPSESQFVLALDEELDEREAAAIARHVEGCGECRTRWDRLKRVSDQIVEYHRGILLSRASGSTIVMPKRTWSLARIASVAGAVAAAACMAWFLVRTDGPHPAQRRAEVHAPALAQASKEALVAPVAKAASTRQGLRRRRSGTVAANMSSFIALPFSDRALPLGDATVVRFELPVEELRLTGLTVDGARAGALVQADVLMGIDGLPRAIRLVQ